MVGTEYQQTLVRALPSDTRGRYALASAVARIQKGYVDEADIIDLYGATIRYLYAATASHIRKRTADEHSPNLYRYFLDLGASAARQNERP